MKKNVKIYSCKKDYSIEYKNPQSVGFEPTLPEGICVVS